MPPTSCSPLSTRHSPSTCRRCGSRRSWPPAPRMRTCSISITSRPSTTRSPDAGRRARWSRTCTAPRSSSLEAIDERARVAEALGTTLDAMPELVKDTARDRAVLDERQHDLLRTTRWDQWRHGDFWLTRLRDQARRADHLVVVSPPDRARAIAVFGVAPDRVTDDSQRRRHRPIPAPRRSPRPSGGRASGDGWSKTPRAGTRGGRPGTVSYREPDLDRLLGPAGDATVLIYVGRFTAAKRVPLLVRAFARARARFERPASLLVWGGYPGEWEDDHPVAVADEVGADGIFFGGWRGHSDLPDGLAICDALVMPSVDDSYPQAPLEAMAVGLPVIATRSGGFPSMINLDPAQPIGWLVPPDDVYALADTLVEAVNRPDELARRGAAALAHAHAELTWSRRVAAFEHAYELARERRATAGSA